MFRMTGLYFLNIIFLHSYFSLMTVNRWCCDTILMYAMFLMLLYLDANAVSIKNSVLAFWVGESSPPGFLLVLLIALVISGPLCFLKVISMLCFQVLILQWAL